MRKIIIIFDYEIIFTQYEAASERIIFEKCNVMLENSKSFKSNWGIHYDNYSNVIDDLKTSFFQHIDFNDEIRELLNIENPYISEECIELFQTVIFFGYYNSKQRIIRNLHTKDFFNFEILKKGGDEELVMFLTPEGMLNCTELKKQEADQRIEFVREFFDKINLTYILQNKDLFKKYNSAFFIVFDNKVFYHYKYPNTDYLNEFMKSRINRPIIANLYFESQANFREIK